MFLLFFSALKTLKTVAMGSRRAFEGAFNLITWKLCIVQGQKRQKSNQTASTQFLENTVNTAGSNVSQNDGNLHGGIIAFILLGCIIFFILVGIFIILRYERRRKSDEYTLKWEKKFEDSSFEMLDCEMKNERRVTGNEKVEKEESGYQFDFQMRSRDDCIDIIQQ